MLRQIFFENYTSLTISQKRIIANFNNSFIKNESNLKLKLIGNEKYIFRPTVPIQPHFNLKTKKEYHKIHSDILNSIKSENPIYFDFVPSNLINPLPILISKSQLDEYKAIQEAIYYSIKAIVSNYFNDKRIQEVFNFSDNVKQILEFYRNKSYDKIGSFRPDFVHEKITCTPKICEINARFTTNGYLMTYYGCEALKNSESLNWLNEKIKIEEILFTKEIISAFKNEFDTNKPIVILRNRETNKDMKALNKVLKNSIQLTAEKVYFNKNENKIFAKISSDKEIKVDQFILELHQDELLSIPTDLIEHMIEKCKILNDLRTIFIVHDKRFLTILNDDELLSDYINQKIHQTIKNHRIKSMIPKKLLENEISYNKVISNKDNWLLKPCLLGKGEGIIFGKNISNTEWKKLVDSSISSQNFIIQNYIEQEDFEILFGSKKKLSVENYKIVGTILCFNDLFLGPGIFRGSQGDLISLNQGGFILYPVKGHLKKFDEVEEINFRQNNLKLKKNLENLVSPILKDNSIFYDLSHGKKSDYDNHKPFIVPQDSIFNLSYLSFKDTELYLKSLIQYGFVLIKLGFKDNQSSFFLSLIRILGDPCVHSANGNDYLWNIKPGYITNRMARSLTKDVFQLHTDASFENIPPRYFGLQVIKADKYDGGKSLLLSIDQLISEMEPTELVILRNKSFRFKIPSEFLKSNNKNVTEGRILALDSFKNNICRYRYDIILDRDQINKECKALNKFENLIDINKSTLIKYFTLEEDSILLVDNCRFLHGRTEIKDMNRHLIRIRFQTNYKEFLPIF